MGFLQKRRIGDFGESQEDLGLALLDLTYSHANKVFHVLVREEFIRDDTTRQTLSSFLEVVSFIHCWIEMGVERRLPRKRLQELNLVFSNIKTSWGTFFADPPEEPRLENESVQSVCEIMTGRCHEYHTSYLANLQAHGRLNALKICCATFLGNVLPGHPIERVNMDNGQKRENDLDEPVLRYIRELVYDLDRDIRIILAQHDP